MACRSVGAISEERPSKREETHARNAEEKDFFMCCEGGQSVSALNWDHAALCSPRIGD